ncbi:MBL fold metallo-hydrolase [bacterium]|nr:MBL fold metallo-hydrolase [bacterium]
MLVEQILTGGDRNFAYVAVDETTKKAMIVDPSYDPDRVYQFCKQNGYAVEYVFNTHGHHDHANGNDRIRELTGLTALQYGMKDPVSGKIIEDGCKLHLGNSEIEILYTPGHTEDSICIHVGDAVFTGDTLFVGKVGGTDFEESAKRQFDSFHSRLLRLPDSTRVYPGHDVGVELISTLGKEKASNPFLLRTDFKDFVDLKKNWLAYKEEHGIQ